MYARSCVRRMSAYERRYDAYRQNIAETLPGHLYKEE